MTLDWKLYLDILRFPNLHDKRRIESPIAQIAPITFRGSSSAHSELVAIGEIYTCIRIYAHCSLSSAQSKHWKTPVLFNSIKHLLFLNESCPHKKLTKKENYSYGLPLLTVTYLRTSRLLIFYLVLVGGRMRLEWIFFEESSRGFNLKLSKSESATSTGIAQHNTEFYFHLMVQILTSSQSSEIR